MPPYWLLTVKPVSFFKFLLPTLTSYYLESLFSSHLELRHLVLDLLVGVLVAVRQEVVADPLREVEVNVAGLVDKELADAGAVHAPHKGDEEEHRLQRDVLHH